MFPISIQIAWDDTQLLLWYFLAFYIKFVIHLFISCWYSNYSMKLRKVGTRCVLCIHVQEKVWTVDTTMPRPFVNLTNILPTRQDGNPAF